MLTPREVAEKRRIDRKVFAGTATRKEILRGIELKAKRDRDEDAMFRNEGYDVTDDEGRLVDSIAAKKEGVIAATMIFRKEGPRNWIGDVTLDGKTMHRWATGPTRNDLIFYVEDTYGSVVVSDDSMSLTFNA